jgi:Ran GTPase-activating protein (RanGAP) involved in mRNA processing and transport
MYDDAIEQLTINCEGIPLNKITSIKHYVNTWGLSSNKWFAENIISKMANLDSIDLSNCIEARHRSDVGRGIEAILEATAGLKIKNINVSKNGMDEDGAKYIKEFLETTPTFKVLKVSDCKLSDASCTIFDKALRVGKPKLKEIDLSHNNISGNGFKTLFNGVSSLNSIEIVNVSSNITEAEDDGLI